MLFTVEDAGGNCRPMEKKREGKMYNELFRVPLGMVDKF